MTTFDDRTKGFENKYAHEQELEFKLLSSGIIRLALWAAGQMGKEGDHADAYAQEVLEEAIGGEMHETPIKHILSDFEKLNITITETEILRKAEEFLEQIQSELEGE